MYLDLHWTGSSWSLGLNVFPAREISPPPLSKPSCWRRTRCFLFVLLTLNLPLGYVPPQARKRDQRSPVGIGISLIDRGLSLVPLANLSWLHAPDFDVRHARCLLKMWESLVWRNTPHLASYGSYGWESRFEGTKVTPFCPSPNQDEPQGLRGDGWNSSVTRFYW